MRLDVSQVPCIVTLNKVSYLFVYVFKKVEMMEIQHCVNDSVVNIVNSLSSICLSCEKLTVKNTR